MRLPEVSRTIEVPDDVTLSLVGKTITVKGEQGSLSRDFSFAQISIEGQDKKAESKKKEKKK